VSIAAALHLGDILLAPTAPEWVEAAIERWPELLLDHASCEKKAASTALALMFTYPEDRPLGAMLSKLAREELKHFEQVQSLIQALGVQFRRQTPSRYAAGLRAVLRTADPGRKLDLLLAAALIEARSCERFRLLAPRLPGVLGALYAQLERSEARHFERYVQFARLEAEGHGAPGSRRSQRARPSSPPLPMPNCAFTPELQREPGMAGSTGTARSTPGAAGSSS
jgi:tRNA 2-(methylsulfanyl)-N6-isopentenyladenosine37 hydroxylase